MIPDLKNLPLHYVLETGMVEDGTWLEFGVFNGNTINYISRFTENKVHGFDSFCGLIEDWNVSNDIKIKKGFYSYRDYAQERNLPPNLPVVNGNVVLHEGLFKDAIPIFMKSNKTPITFMHIDCDTYFSTMVALENTVVHVRAGCIIVFDELINYPNYASHEYRALYEWTQDNEIVFDFIGMDGVFNKNVDVVMDKRHQSVAIKIIENKRCIPF